MAGLDLTYLAGADIDALALPAADILSAVSDVLAAQGRGETVIEPRVHLFPGGGADGHFNVLRGALPLAAVAGVKVVGDYVGNHARGLPSELALLTLYDASTGAPTAILDATAITAMRTGAVTAVGARHLARPDSRVLAHIGSRGTAEWNVRLLCHVLPGLEEVRIHSRTAASRTALAARLEAELGLSVRAVEGWEECVRGADVVVEATRLVTPEPLLRTEWIAPGALVVPYGTVSAVALDLTDVMDKIVVDDWGQARAGPLGALRAHVDSGRLSETNLHAELGEIVCGSRPAVSTTPSGSCSGTAAFSLTDIALGRAMLGRAEELGIGYAAALPLKREVGHRRGHESASTSSSTPRELSRQPNRRAASSVRLPERATPAWVISAFQSAHPRPRAQVPSSSSSAPRNARRLSPTKNVHAIARSQAGSPTAEQPKSRTALSRPFSTSRFEFAMSPCTQTAGRCQTASPRAASHTAVAASASSSPPSVTIA